MSRSQRIALLSVVGWLVPFVVPVAAQGAPEASTSAPVPAALDSTRAALLDYDYWHLDRAERRLRAAVAADPGYGPARAWLAFLRADLDRAARGDEFARAIQSASRSTPGELLLITALREWRLGSTSAAAALLRTAAQLTPDDARLARLSIDNPGADPGRLLEEVQNLIRRFPAYGPLYNTLAYKLLDGGDGDGALRAAGEQLRLAPDQPNAHDTYGDLLFQAGRTEEAARYFRRAVEIAPDYTPGYEGLAWVEHLKGRHAQALEYLRTAERAATSGVTRRERRESLAGGLLLSGQPALAIGELTRIAAAAAANGDGATERRAHLRMALIEGGTGGGEGIGVHRAAALAVAGTPHTFGEATIGLAHAFAGRADSALAIAKRVASRVRQDAPGAQLAQARQLTGWAMLSAGRCGEALTEFSGADTTSVVALAGMAECAWRTGDRKRGRELAARIRRSHEIDLRSDPATIARLRAARLR